MHGTCTKVAFVHLLRVRRRPFSNTAHHLKSRSQPRVRARLGNIKCVFGELRRTVGGKAALYQATVARKTEHVCERKASKAELSLAGAAGICGDGGRERKRERARLQERSPLWWSCLNSQLESARTSV